MKLVYPTVLQEVSSAFGFQRLIVYSKVDFKAMCGQARSHTACTTNVDDHNIAMDGEHEVAA